MSPRPPPLTLRPVRPGRGRDQAAPRPGRVPACDAPLDVRATEDRLNAEQDAIEGELGEAWLAERRRELGAGQ